jgi:D-sedoheptulose 7-phosphate isomerase
LLALDIDGVMTDGTVAVRADGREMKRVSFVDLDAVGKARRAGLSVWFVTGEDTASVDLIARRFGVQDVVRGAKDKAKALRAISRASGVPAAQICYVGDSDKDVPGLASVGLGLAPSTATPAARAAAHKVLRAKGGHGAVAEAISLVFSLNGSAAREAAIARAMRAPLAESIRLHRVFARESVPVLARVAVVIADAIASGRTVYLFGNGGSAADAQHVAGELVGRFAIESRPWPAVALTTDTSILTAVGNDYGFTEVFARQVRALARPGDVVVGISTSGRSPNVLKALKAAKALGAVTIGFTGANGRKMQEHCDPLFFAPADTTPRIQELYLLAWHLICEQVEKQLHNTI